MSNVSILTAFSFGLLSFLSPCVLPMIPLYVSYILGESTEKVRSKLSKLYVIKKALGFIFGFSTVFFILQLSIGGLSHYFFQYRDIVIKLGGILIILFGIHISGIFKFSFLLKQINLIKIEKMSFSMNSYILGVAFAAGWTPCVDPLLATVIILGASMDTFWQGVYLMIFYSIGLGLPFLIVALGIESISNYFKKIQNYLHLISVMSGILMILMGLTLFFDKLSIVTSFLNELIPIQ